MNELNNPIPCKYLVKKLSQFCYYEKNIDCKINITKNREVHYIMIKGKNLSERYKKVCMPQSHIFLTYKAKQKLT